MLSPQKQREYFQRIRALEDQLYPGMQDHVLTTKAIEGIIKQGASQGKLERVGWLEREVRGKVENIRKTQAEGNRLRNINREPRPWKLPKLTNQVKKNPIEPRPLKAIEAKHDLTIHFDKTPDYQEMEKYTRLSFLLNGFEYEVHVGKNKWLDFLKNSGKRPSWTASVTGSIESETQKGFLVPNGVIKLKLARLKNAARRKRERKAEQAGVQRAGATSVEPKPKATFIKRNR